MMIVTRKNGCLLLEVKDIQGHTPFKVKGGWGCVVEAVSLTCKLEVFNLHMKLIIPQSHSTMYKYIVLKSELAYVLELGHRCSDENFYGDDRTSGAPPE